MNKYIYRIGDYNGTICRVTALGNDLYKMEPLNLSTGTYTDPAYILTTFVLNRNYRRKLSVKVVNYFILDGGYMQFQAIH